MASYTPVPGAGRQRLPAAELHPDDPIPKQWRILSTWAYRGQRGAWLTFVQEAPAELSRFGGRLPGVVAQVVYHANAGRSATAHVSICLFRAGGLLACRRRPVGLRHERNPEWLRACERARADYGRANGIDFDALDRAEDREFQSGLAVQAPSRVPPTPANASALLSDKIDVLDLPPGLYNAFYRNGIRNVQSVILMTERDVGMMRGVGLKRVAQLKGILAAHGLALNPNPTQRHRWGQGVFRVADEPGLAPLSAPPAPGLSRAEWLGERITSLTAVQSVDLSPHAKRRSAARRILARMAGYEAERPDEDALYIVCGSVALAGLNEYARRVLDGEEDGHAVL